MDIRNEKNTINKTATPLQAIKTFQIIPPSPRIQKFPSRSLPSVLVKIAILVILCSVFLTFYSFPLLPPQQSIIGRIEDLLTTVKTNLLPDNSPIKVPPSSNSI
jgi:hypothetical protein